MILNPNESYEDELWDSQKQRERELLHVLSRLAWLLEAGCGSARPVGFSLGLRAKKFALPREPQKLGYTRWWRGLSWANDRSPKTRQGDFLHVYLKRVDGGGSAI